MYIIKVGTKRDVNRLRDQALKFPGMKLVSNSQLSVEVEVQGKTYLSCIRCRGGWSIRMEDQVYVEENRLTRYSWSKSEEKPIVKED